MRLTFLFFPLLCCLAGTPAIAAENLPTAVVIHLNRQGPLVSSSFFRSVYPAPQMVVHYCVDENLKGGKNEGANNAANTHCSIALFNRGRGSRWAFGEEVDLGQGTVKDFGNGWATAESVNYGDNDALCCPSRRTEIRFNTSGGKLVRISE